jgi:hypothetical protein
MPISRYFSRGTADAQTTCIMRPRPEAPRSNLLALAVATLVAACAGAQTSAPPPATTTTTAASAGAAEGDAQQCTLVCEGAQLVRHPAAEPDYSARALANANAVLEALHPDLLACYRARVAVRPSAHGFITVDLVVAPDGHVQRVETTGGALLGDATMACIVKRLQRAEFEPPHGGGTMHLHVPFSLRRVSPDET